MTDRSLRTEYRAAAIDIDAAGRAAVADASKPTIFIEDARRAAKVFAAMGADDPTLAYDLVVIQSCPLPRWENVETIKNNI